MEFAINSLIRSTSVLCASAIICKRIDKNLNCLYEIVFQYYLY